MRPIPAPLAPAPRVVAPSQRRLAIVLMSLVAVIWGVNVSVMKLALTEVSPLAFNALRFPLGTLALALLLRRFESERMPVRSEWRLVVILGLAAHPLYQLCFLNGLWLTSASHTAVIVATTPVWVALGDRFALGERLPRMVWTGIGISFVGVIVLSAARGADSGGVSLLGDLLVLLSGMIWAFYLIRSRPLLRARSSLWVTAWTLFVGTPVIVLIGIPDLLRLDWGSLTSRTWGGGAYAGLLALATAYSWVAFGVQTLGASRTAIFANLIPVIALTVAWLWLGERLPALSWAGAALALAGVWITTVSRTPPAPRG